METKKTKGEIGFWRRATGVIFGMLTATALFLSGFGFYSIDYRFIWAGGTMAAVMLIAGIAKDVTAIIKAKMD